MNGDIIYAYTRKQAVADGEQIEVTTYGEELPTIPSYCKQAGLRIPVFITRSVWDAYVKVPDGVEGQDLTGRLWDVLYMTATAIRCHVRKGLDGPAEVLLNVRNSSSRAAEMVTLWCDCGPVDIDDPRPCLTIMTREDM